MRTLPTLLCLAACASFPEVEAKIPPGSVAGAPPPLMPLAEALAAVPPVDPGRDADVAATAAGAASLRARAASLEGRADGADVAARLARLRARAEVLSRPAPDIEAIEAIADDLSEIE